MNANNGVFMCAYGNKVCKDKFKETTKALLWLKMGDSICWPDGNKTENSGSLQCPLVG